MGDADGTRWGCGDLPSRYDAAMRIVMVASECEPFAKTGGLADVVDALARALGRRGHEVDVVLPFYRGLKPPAGQLRRQTVSVAVGERPGERRDVGDQATVDLVDGQADGYRLRLVDHPYSFDRADYYVDGGTDYPDNAARFTLLARAALAGHRARWPAGRRPPRARLGGGAGAARAPGGRDASASEPVGRGATGS